MSKEIGGLGITRLSDQINIDKWAMMVRGLYSDRFTRTATLGILNRSLRIKQTDTDHGYEAIVQPAEIPNQMRSLIMLMNEYNAFPTKIIIIYRFEKFSENIPEFRIFLNFRMDFIL